MPEIEPTTELNEAFSEPGAAARPWTVVAEVLSQAEMFWLSTVRRDGRPHVTPLSAIWLDGMLHFCAGSHEQKAKNLHPIPAASSRRAPTSSGPGSTRWSRERPSW